MSGPDHNQLLPYLLELRNVLDAALYRFEQLEEAAARWLGVATELDSTARSAGEPGRAGLLQKMVREQSFIFDAVEAFLALYARASLLLFPVGGKDQAVSWRLSRGVALRAKLGLAATDLAHRDVRDAWMHFDERLDAAIARGSSGGGQLFKLSYEVTDSMREHALRLIEVDRLVLAYRNRDGAVRTSALRALRGEIQSLEVLLTKTLSGGLG